MTTPAESVAVLSDIHGVLPVLDAVLAQPEVQAADLIVACGDHAAGPQPVEVLDRLTAIGNVVLVRGNADRDLVALARGEYPPDGEAYPVDAWAAAQLSPAHVDLLAGPDRAAWAEDYLRATASDADAIAAFGPRDGRPAR
jgi:hypothetical protein